MRWFVAFAFLALSAGILGSVLAPPGSELYVPASPGILWFGLLGALLLLGGGALYAAGRRHGGA